MTLGRLEKVEVRDIWKTEDQDFTPWLAREENISLLGDALGLELEVEAEEKPVGPFRADILCKDVGNDSWVLIENQLERTDHKHLGQLMTYAAGLKAVTIVWIATRFTDEHRKALDWLNDITDETFRFFGLEVELWQIGNSPVAPKFNIVSKPNEWSKAVIAATKRIANEALTETTKMQLAYWQGLQAHLNDKSHIRTHKPFPVSWTTASVGRTGTNLGAVCNTRKNLIGIELYLSGKNAKQFFAELENDKPEIEQQLGFRLEWHFLPTKRDSRIIIYQENSSLVDEARWSSYFQWMTEKLEAFDRVFRPRVKLLDPDAWQDVEAENEEVNE
ncbi:MAG: DUF4268 domain-containing protein [Alphaproteobacteria bacterium]